MNFNCPAYKGLLSAILRINWQQAALASILASQAKPSQAGAGAYKAPLRQRSIQLSAGQNVYEMTMPAQRRRAYLWCFSPSHNFYELHKYATLMVNAEQRRPNENTWKLPLTSIVYWQLLGVLKVSYRLTPSLLVLSKYNTISLGPTRGPNLIQQVNLT